MESIGFTTIAEGDSKFIMTFGVPIAEELDEMSAPLNMHVRPLPDHKMFLLDTGAKNIETFTVGVFGVLLFLPGWFAKKLLDEIYDLKLKPVVRKILKQANEIEIYASKKKYKTFTLSVYYKEYSTVVIVAVKERGLDELATSLDRIRAAHAAALATLQTSSSPEPVHLYLIKDGKVNVEPYMHKTFASALGQINS